MYKYTPRAARKSEGNTKSKPMPRRLKANVVQLPPVTPVAPEEAGEAILDFSGYDFAGLLKIRNLLQAEIETRQGEEIARLRAHVAEAAGNLGISIKDVLRPFAHRTDADVSQKRKGRFMYQGPNGEHWTGFGPCPKWLRLLTENGRSREDFRIP